MGPEVLIAPLALNKKQGGNVPLPEKPQVYPPTPPLAANVAPP
jgi:hypothetical protein